MSNQEHTADSHHDSHGHHGASLGTLILVFVTLLVLMAVTVWAAGIDLPGKFTNNIVLLLIACTKATLVIMYFMGAKYNTKLVQLYVLCGFVWFLTMFIVFTDYFSRRYEPVQGWEINAPTSLPRLKEGPGVEAQPEVDRILQAPRY